MRNFVRQLILWPLTAIFVAVSACGTAFHIHTECGGTRCCHTSAPEHETAQHSHHAGCGHSHSHSATTCAADAEPEDSTTHGGFPALPQKHDHANCVVCQFYAHLKTSTAAAAEVVVENVEVVEEVREERWISADAPRNSRPRAPPAAYGSFSDSCLARPCFWGCRAKIALRCRDRFHLLNPNSRAWRRTRLWSAVIRECGADLQPAEVLKTEQACLSRCPIRVLRRDSARRGCAP